MVSLLDLALSNNSTTARKPRAKDLNTVKNIKPARPKGHLVETPLYMAPVEYCKDLARDTYGIVKGWKGEANDYELGKQNDVAMKLGSLAIAGYLMTFRKSKLPRLMELVGFGSFFTSMALWPKLAISLPIKMRTGVDIQQKYVDSYGRKKDFFQDPQYLAWDLFRKDKLEKMGKKMNIPDDVPNRDEVIQEKARKLAVQGNTLWMATAGFATPTMTALICNRLEPAVETLKQKYDLSHTQKVMDGQNWFKSSMAAPKKANDLFEKFITENMGRKIKADDQLVSIFNWTTAEVSESVEQSLKNDLTKLLTVKNDITPEYVDGLYDTFAKPLTDAGVDREALAKAFKDGKLYGDAKGLVKRYQAANPATAALSLEDASKEILTSLIDKNAPKETVVGLKGSIKTDMVKNYVAAFNTKVLDEETATQLRKTFGAISDYFQKEKEMVQWVGARCANSADSMSSYGWKRVTNAAFKALGFTGKELEVLELQGPKSKELLVSKLEELVKDPVRYKKAVTKIAKAVAEFDAVNDSAARERYFGYVDTLCDNAKAAFKKLGFVETAERIGGREFIRNAEGKILNEKEALSGTLKNLKKVNFDFRVLGERASFYRIIQTLDLFKKINDGTFEGQFNVICAQIGEQHKPNFNAVKELAVKTMLSSGSGAHNDKLGLSGVTNTYKTIMRILFGALPDEDVQRAMRDLSTNVRERKPIIKACFEEGTEAGYKAAVKAGFDKVKLNMARTGMTQDTIEGLYDASVQFNRQGAKSVDLVENMKKYMKTFIDKVVNYDNGRARGFDLGNNQADVKGIIQGLPGNGSPKIKQELIGLSTEKFFRQGAEGLANTRKWTRIFGIGGAVLFAGTVIATLFFGHIPTKEMYMKDGNKQ